MSSNNEPSSIMKNLNEQSELLLLNCKLKGLIITFSVFLHPYFDLLTLDIIT